ncbi:EexN family lipoprotein [Solimonas terrae]|uniref:EexN family lipoprotein n=1 Tax=Solimonas terrae TaxID=1396819 RepID=A0A6M2BUJ2_9GAMM|nr:EexN family lipoprotein [Solimonas terrae]NGY05915.1 EexN family lipoprotein [Solimonas terrae]
MKHVSILLPLVMLAACGVSTPADTVDSLVADPQRLKEVQRLCKEDHAKMGDAVCVAAAVANRRRFVGDGTGKYTPSSTSQH